MEINKISKNNLTRESQHYHRLASQEDEVSLHELFRVIWHAKVIIFTVAAIFGISAIFYAVNQPNIYKSEVLLVPTENEGAGGLAKLASQFGGLASLAGVNLGGGNTNKIQLAIEVLKSRQFTSEFIEKHNILPQLMAAKSWNMNDNEIVFDEDLYNNQNNKWVREVSAPFEPKPSMQEAYKEFKKILSVQVDEKSGAVTLAVQHVSPFIAQQWVKWLVEDINQTMKEREVTEAKRSTEFLYEQLKDTEVADIREVLFRLIEEQTKTIMFAKVREEYVFKTIDAAVVPEEKFRPKRAIIVILATMLGGMLSLMAVLIKYFARREHR